VASLSDFKAALASAWPAVIVRPMFSIAKIPSFRAVYAGFSRRRA
jgi:hypothetical protein